MTDAVMECPICYENIEGVINSITTECGHKFHANCLMKNVLFNGFGCPCCRTKMVEQEETNDSDDSDSDGDNNDSDSDDSDSDDSDSDDSDSDDSDSDDNDQYSEFALLGLRLFTARIEGEEPDPKDIEINYSILFPGETQTIPTQEYVTEKLQDKGITIYQLVSTLMLDHEEYDGCVEYDENYENISTKIREIINEFKTKNEMVGLSDTLNIL
jgi:hypothetical protein